MPQYDFYCDTCRLKYTRYLSFAEFDTKRDTQRCQCCEGTLVPAMNCPTFIGRKKPGSAKRPRVRCVESGPGGFMANSTENDGFLNNRQRQMAKAIARKAGVSTAGKKWFPQLTRDGHPMDPLAWCADSAEVAAKVQALGRSCTGAFEVKGVVKDEIYARAESQRDNYRVAPDLVQPEVNAEIKERLGGKATTNQRRELTEKYVEIHSGTKPKKRIKSLSRGV